MLNNKKILLLFFKYTFKILIKAGNLNEIMMQDSKNAL
jgi:hypothetical protein